jgi:hypothetical protein
VVIDDDPDVRTFLSDFRNLCGVVVARHCAVATLVMADIVFADATWHEVKSAFMPDSLPSVEQVA